jgi:hypothetical protein
MYTHHNIGVVKAAIRERDVEWGSANSRLQDQGQTDVTTQSCMLSCLYAGMRDVSGQL